MYLPFTRVIAELAVEPDQIQRGLMHRRSVPDGTGMLFDMGHSAPHRFWMQNVLVSLDLIFLSADGVVIGIVPDAVPGDPTLRGIRWPSRYVLEVPGGWCARNRVRVGQRAEMVAAPP